MLAMHVPNLGIHTLCTHPSFLFFTHVKKESICSCLCRRSAKLGLLNTLRLVLRCAVARHFLSFSCRKQDWKDMHDTQCINRLGLFITRRRVVEKLRVVFAFVFPSAYTGCVVTKVGKPRRSSPPGGVS